MLLHPPPQEISVGNCTCSASHYIHVVSAESMG